MAKYLSTGDIALAVARLGSSSAKSRLCEFLIGMRTLTLAGVAEVGIAESVDEFRQATDELTRVGMDDDHSGLGGPFFNPFGGQAGFKSRKFASNGPSNTMHGWATQKDSPFAVDGRNRPKTISRRPANQDTLRSFLLQRNGAPDRPRLIDAAIWYLRASDVERADGSEPTRSQLEQLFQDDFGLTDDDVAALFRLAEEDSEQEVSDDLTGSEANDDAMRVPDALEGQ